MKNRKLLSARWIIVKCESKLGRLRWGIRFSYLGMWGDSLAIHRTTTSSPSSSSSSLSSPSSPPSLLSSSWHQNYTYILLCHTHSSLYQKDACFENAVLWKYGLCKKDRLWLNEATNPVANPLIPANRDRKGPVSAICRRNAFADEVISRTRSYRAVRLLSHLSSILRILWDCNVKGSYLNVPPQKCTEKLI